MSKKEKFLKEKLNFYSSLGLEKFAISKTLSKNQRHWKFRNKHQFVITKPIYSHKLKRMPKIHATASLKKKRPKFLSVVGSVFIREISFKH